MFLMGVFVGYLIRAMLSDRVRKEQIALRRLVKESPRGK